MNPGAPSLGDACMRKNLGHEMAAPAGIALVRAPPPLVWKPACRGRSCGNPALAWMSLK
jgi:hypothetical protein